MSNSRLPPNRFAILQQQIAPSEEREKETIKSRLEAPTATPSEEAEDIQLSDLVRAQCPLFEELTQLCRKGWQDKELDTHFKSLRQKNKLGSSFEEEVSWLRTLSKSMREMDDILDFIPSSGKFVFLDLGCAPGGYSQYILYKHQFAIGQGMTLPAVDGGHRFLLPNSLKERYGVHYNDLTGYDLTLSQTNSAQPPLPFLPASFDFIILDGHALRTRAFEWRMPIVLLLSQLVIGLRSVKDGGSLFITLSGLATLRSARILHMLDQLAERLETVKPRTLHGNRRSFYVLARNVRRGPMLEHYMKVLLGVKEAVLNPKETEARGLWNVWEQLVPFDELKETYVDRLIELGTPVWTVQRDCLKTFLLKKGVKTD